MPISSQGADKFRLKHAEELLALFESARGRPARTTDELAQWLDSVDDDLADDIAREVAEEAGRTAGRETLYADWLAHISSLQIAGRPYSRRQLLPNAAIAASRGLSSTHLARAFRMSD
jgi:hypothetical protein